MKRKPKIISPSNYKGAWERLCHVTHFNSEAEEGLDRQARNNFYEFYSELKFATRSKFIEKLDELSVSENFRRTLRAFSRCPLLSKKFYKSLLRSYHPERDRTATTFVRELTDYLISAR